MALCFFGPRSLCVAGHLEQLGIRRRLAWSRAVCRRSPWSAAPRALSLRQGGVDLVQSPGPLRDLQVPSPPAGQRGTISGAGGHREPYKEGPWGEFSVLRKVRSELLRPESGLLDPVKHLRMCF